MMVTITIILLFESQMHPGRRRMSIENAKKMSKDRELTMRAPRLTSSSPLTTAMSTLLAQELAFKIWPPKPARTLQEGVRSTLMTDLARRRRTSPFPMVKQSNSTLISK